MAELSNVTYLMRAAAATPTVFTKLIDIHTYPDLGGAPEEVDVTTLSDTKRKNILGLQDNSAHEFGAFYDATSYAALVAIQEEGNVDVYRLYFGENGEDGIFEWSGRLSVYANGHGVGEAREITITISDEGDEPITYVGAGE